MTRVDETRESTEKIVSANGVDLCVETFGDPADEAILLIGGAASSMDYWDDELCERLAAGETRASARFVIRYDLRDTGRSVSYEAGAPPYTRGDLAVDAVGVLDALGVARAHVVGMSMGGGLAQLVALDHPDRVATLTLISTSPGGPGGQNDDLPAMSDELARVFSEPAAEPDWSDREAVVDYLVDADRPFAGSLPFDEAGKRSLAGRVFDRTDSIASAMTNHWILEDGEPTRPRLGDVTASTLVLHGTEDPLLPYGHGVALAREIPGAQLVPLEHVGHEMPPREVWDVLVSAILKHTAGDR